MVELLCVLSGRKIDSTTWRDKKQKKTFKFDLKGIFEWAHLESNQAPTDYESVALTE
jgi:hypothetical protein